MSRPLKQSILQEARRLGFVLAGVTTPEPPPHTAVFEAWLADGRHASMEYLSTERARERRRDPKLILPDCKSILVLAIPYSKPSSPRRAPEENPGMRAATGRIAAYAWGNDYHAVLPGRLQSIVAFIENNVGHPVSNRWYTDTGPILERDLAQRAGLGWIGKNTCLIHPQHGSYFLLAEILLGLELEPDPQFDTDRCGTCTRCLKACPTQCIRPDRTIDAGRCISYLTIELKDGIPEDMRHHTGNWIFGCDICQEVCPWNRFAPPEGEPAFRADDASTDPRLASEIRLVLTEFNRRYKHNAIRRTRHRGYLRNVLVALGNAGTDADLPSLEDMQANSDPMLREHAAWAINEIKGRGK